MHDVWLFNWNGWFHNLECNSIRAALQYNKCRKTDEVDFYCSPQTQRNQHHGLYTLYNIRGIAFERIRDAIVVFQCNVKKEKLYVELNVIGIDYPNHIII